MAGVHIFFSFLTPSDLPSKYRIPKFMGSLGEKGGKSFTVSHDAFILALVLLEMLDGCIGSQSRFWEQITDFIFKLYVGCL